MGNSCHPGSSVHGGWLPTAAEGTMILVMVMAGGDFPVHTDSQSTALVAPRIVTGAACVIAGCAMQFEPTLEDVIAIHRLRGVM